MFLLSGFSSPRRLFLPVLAMISVIAVSNFLVLIPLGAWLTAGALLWPVTFLVNDLTNRHLGAPKARSVIYISLLPAFFLSLWLASPRVAFASVLAFGLSQFLDILIFDKLRRRVWWKAPLISTVIASLFDTVLFYMLAFMATGSPWLQWALGDQLVKWASAVLLLLPFRLLKDRPLFR